MLFSLFFVFAEMPHTLSLGQLKLDLIQAEQELVLVQQKITSLGQDIAKKELALIKEELEVLHIRAVEQSLSSLYMSALLKKREILTRIIKTVPHYREEAVELQNEVLSLITNFRDKEDVVINEEDQDSLR